MRAILDSFDFVPRSCTWELTLRCNLNCGHCGSRAGVARAGEMSRDRMLGVMGELAALGCRRVTLSGGEPTLSEHWQAVASEGARLGVRLNMITNGVTVGRDFVRSAKDSGLCNLGVSLDGLEEEHEAIRGRRGLFSNVMALLEQCEAERIPVGVITTVCKSNFRQLDQIHDRIAGRVFVWQVQIGAALGNLRDHRQNQIDPEDLLVIVPKLAELIQRRKIAVRVSDNLGYFGPYEETLRKSRRTPAPCWIGCYAGCRHVGIEANGGVKGCLSIQASTAKEGNLQTESLAEIWRRKGAFAYNREFKLDDLRGFCRTCVHAEICRGGCLSMRTCEGGGENPFCYHRVATLAERKTPKGRARYVPMAIAPAALLSMIGCFETASSEATPFYGVPFVPNADKEASSDTSSFDTAFWEINPQDAALEASFDATALYGLPLDAGEDGSESDAKETPLPEGSGDSPVVDSDIEEKHSSPDSEIED